jgi:hypothetical protein
MAKPWAAGNGFEMFWRCPKEHLTLGYRNAEYKVVNCAAIWDYGGTGRDV